MFTKVVPECVAMSAFLVLKAPTTIGKAMKIAKEVPKFYNEYKKAQNNVLEYMAKNNMINK